MGRISDTDNIRNLTHNHSNFKGKRKIMMICDNEPDVLLFEHVFRSKYDLIMVGSGVLRDTSKQQTKVIKYL